MYSGVNVNSVGYIVNQQGQYVTPDGRALPPGMPPIHVTQINQDQLRQQQVQQNVVSVDANGYLVNMYGSYVYPDGTRLRAGDRPVHQSQQGGGGRGQQQYGNPGMGFPPANMQGGFDTSNMPSGGGFGNRQGPQNMMSGIRHNPTNYANKVSNRYANDTAAAYTPPAQQQEQQKTAPVVKSSSLPFPGSEFPPLLPTGLFSDKDEKNGYFKYIVKGDKNKMKDTLEKVHTLDAYQVIDAHAGMMTMSTLHHSPVSSHLRFLSEDKGYENIILDTVVLSRIIVSKEFPNNEFSKMLEDSVDLMEFRRLLNNKAAAATDRDVLYYDAIDNLFTDRINDVIKDKTDLDLSIDSFVEDFEELALHIMSNVDVVTSSNENSAIKEVFNIIKNNILSLGEEVFTTGEKGENYITVFVPQFIRVVYSTNKDIVQAVSSADPDIKKFKIESESFQTMTSLLNKVEFKDVTSVILITPAASKAIHKTTSGYYTIDN